MHPFLVVLSGVYSLELQPASRAETIGVLLEMDRPKEMTLENPNVAHRASVTKPTRLLLTNLCSVVNKKGER